MLLNDLRHGSPGPLQQDIRRCSIHFRPESGTELADSCRCSPASRNQSQKIRTQPLWLATVSAHELHDGLIHLASFEQFHCRNLQAIVEDGLGVDTHGSRNLTLHIRHVAKIGSPSHELVFVVDGKKHNHVVQMRNSAFDLVDIVGDEHISFLDLVHFLLVHLVRPDFHKLPDKTSKLAHEHLALGVGDDVKLILLLTNRRRHGTSQHQCIHLRANGSQG